MERSFVITSGPELVPGLRVVDSVEARFRNRHDTVDVALGSSWLLLTVADAALLVDKLTAALDARTATLRAVA
ncbi:hypothetical protein IU453_00970 [Nocardia cyriacigeorgica]|uniref:hypothetical protein n=1 Tax=Nocardia cyriacigeorgica TaxID=135487 RepID=UPI0018935EAF|nr:hypothetical protein [Nocardia cyriacigeorgica]MBF6092357.1 hypothetical protein [Nocardia cyriacigeorgica]MBF6162909.1 hypothetical protein [Nocardia cyriacigeorgica]MBF6201791.1 hypothetical protein [Nocardia cyriacigeorgica]MBF6315356.1 hypothetical protein [Nocardia cyriacigeorgica]MBF6530142.1 hypothetical protein [Nocardia cyriacigeorgica]